MSGLAKGLIITGVVVFILVVLVAGVGVYLVATRGPELIEKSKQTIAEGEEFGRATDNQGCLTESLKRYKHNPGMGTAISVELFLTSCLRASKDTPGFCDGVPKPTELMNSIAWRINKCTAEGMANDTYCQQIFGQVQTFCESRRLGRESNDNNSR